MNDDLSLNEPPKKPPESPAQPQGLADVAMIIRQLEDLVKLSLECENKELKPGVSFVEVNKKLLAIRKDIERFHENYRRHLSASNLKPEDTKPTPADLASLGEGDRLILEKLHGLLSTCEDARERMHESLAADQEAYKAVKGEIKDKSKEKIHRKGKFKGVGGKQGWIPT